MSKDEENEPSMSASGAERIGYGHPPKQTRFKPGRSPNPRGRPKGARGRAKVLHDVAFETHTIIENGEPVRRTTIELVLLSVRNHAAAGNARAARICDAFLEQYGAKEPIEPTGYLIVPQRLTPQEFIASMEEERKNHHKRIDKLKAEHAARRAAWTAEHGR